MLIVRLDQEAKNMPKLKGGKEISQRHRDNRFDAIQVWPQLMKLPLTATFDAFTSASSHIMNGSLPPLRHLRSNWNTL